MNSYLCVYDTDSGELLYHVRSEGENTGRNNEVYARKREDWVCHEMWTDDGKTIICHGGYDQAQQ
ncbi:MAG: hypothetical protein J6M92_06760 [Oribacterium sp.]|nr:hypothetical protein [Oribacterium sp.]